MTQQIATQTKTPVLVVQEYGAFDVRAGDESTLHVHCPNGILANGLLYQFAGVMIKHETGWRFRAESLAMPKLSPKARAAAVEVLTVKVNEYVEQHPDLFAVVAVQRWERRYKDMQYTIRQTQARLVSEQARIEGIQREQGIRQDRLQDEQRELQEHLAKKPEGARIPEDA